VASQQVPPSTALTGPLVFTENGVAAAGPIGTITASDPAAAPSLSADGQSYNFTSLAIGAATLTLTWHDPAGNVADFASDFTDQPVPIIMTGAFGTAGPGLTA
jgi:hypothetical protein